RVMEARPQSAGPYLEVADFYEQRRDGRRMAEALDAAVALRSTDPQLAYYRGVAAVLLGDKNPEAEPLLKRHPGTVPPRSAPPTPASAHEWLGHLYERQGRTEAAIAEYHEALRLDHDQRGAKEALRRLGRP